VQIYLYESTFDHGEEAIYGASFCPAEGYVISGCGGGVLHLWDASGSHTKSLAIAENSHEGGVTSVTFGSALVSSMF
jgi:WD40 repeat protein